MRKKVFAILISLAMCIAMLTGCGGEKASNTETKAAESKSETAEAEKEAPETTETKEEKTSTEPVSFLLPGDYFGVEEEGQLCTQEQLDQYSVNGLKYEFTDDDQIRCTVVDQPAAQKAAKEAVDADFADFTDPEGYMYVESYQELSYNEDLTEITITCNKEKWSEYDSWYGAVFISRAHNYQLISGWPEEDTKCNLVFVDENGEELAADSMDAYK